MTYLAAEELWRARFNGKQQVATLNPAQFLKGGLTRLSLRKDLGQGSYWN